MNFGDFLRSIVRRGKAAARAIASSTQNVIGTAADRVSSMITGVRDRLLPPPIPLRYFESVLEVELKAVNVWIGAASRTPADFGQAIGSASKLIRPWGSKSAPI
jgi:hypothetical protein